METQKRVDVCIPTYHPQKFNDLLFRLRKQTIRPGHIYVINTDREGWDETVPEAEDLTIVHINKEDFDHGATRNRLGLMSDADFLLFMTQDALPGNTRLIEEMVKSFDTEGVGAVYARQVAREGAGITERLTRSFNYPGNACIKTWEDAEKMGIKVLFCSNVCAMYDRVLWKALGGFVDHTIFNEDMIYAKKMLLAGGSIVYQSRAVVIHSHDYTISKEFKRSFDLGVSQRMYADTFEGLTSEKEGTRLVSAVTKSLVKEGSGGKLIRFYMGCAARLAGYRLGRAYDKLPRLLVVKLSDQKDFWDKKI